MRKFTVEQIMTWKPCYDRAKVEALIGDGKTATEIGALDILADDRVWALVRALRDAKGLTALCDAAGTFALRAHYHAANSANAAYYYADAAAYAERAAYYAAEAAYAAYYAAAYAAAAYAAAADDHHTAAAAAATAAADRAYYAANAANSAYADERAAQISYLVEVINA